MFYAELDSNITLSNATVLMGGEKRPFVMAVEKIDAIEWGKIGDNYHDKETPQYLDFQKIILLSDAFVKPDIYKKCLYAITDLTTFRNIKTTVSKTTKWADLSEDDAQKPLIAGEKRYLLSRGSVLFFDAKNDISSDLATPQYQRIGYNYFTTI